MRPVLRGYQVDVVNRTREAFRQVHRVVLVVPTGGGKTVIGGNIIDSSVEKDKRVLFLAHRKELIDQASDKLDQFSVRHGVIKAGRQADLAQSVQVASVQTLARRLELLTRPITPAEMACGRCADHLRPFDLVVVDECHHIVAGTYQRILAAWPQARILGLTATPYRIDLSPLADCFEQMVVGITVPELIQQGYLVTCRTFAPPPPEALQSVHSRAGEFVAGEAAAVLDRTGPTREIIATWKLRAAGRLTVGFGCTVEHCEHLAQAFRDDGVPSAVIDGTMTDDERTRVLADLKHGIIKVLWNVNVLTEGFDMPDLSALIWARPTKSRSFWRQGVGRIMRPAPGKLDGIILDHAANAHRFGSPNEADDYSLKDKRPDSGRSGGGRSQLGNCPKCHLQLSQPVPVKCPQCQHTLREERGGAAERGELLLEELSPADEADRYEWYLKCVGTAIATSRKLGWVWHRYRDRWGEPPPVWMPVKARIYERIYDRPVPERLQAIADSKATHVMEVFA